MNDFCFDSAVSGHIAAEDDNFGAAAREYDALLTEATDLALAETQTDCQYDLINWSNTTDWKTVASAAEGATFVVVGTLQSERDAFYRWFTRDNAYFPALAHIDGHAMPLASCLRLARDIERAPAGRALVRITDVNSCTSTLARFVRHQTNAAVLIDLARNLAHYAPRMHSHDFSFVVLTASATFADFEEALFMMCEHLELNEVERADALARWHFTNANSPLAEMENGDALVVPLNHHMRLHGFNEPQMLRGLSLFS